MPNLAAVICVGGQLSARAWLKRKIARQAEADHTTQLADAQRRVEERAKAGRGRAPQDPELGAGNGGDGAWWTHGS